MEDQGLGPRRGWAQSGLASTGSPGTGGRPAQSGTQSGDIEAKGLLEKMNGCYKTLTPHSKLYRINRTEEVCNVPLFDFPSLLFLNAKTSQYFQSTMAMDLVLVLLFNTSMIPHNSYPNSFNCPHEHYL